MIIKTVPHLGLRLHTASLWMVVFASLVSAPVPSSCDPVRVQWSAQLRNYEAPLSTTIQQQHSGSYKISSHETSPASSK